MMKNTIATLGIILASTVTSQAAIVMGDLAIVGFNSDGTDNFHVLALNEIASGETLLFTDNGWLSSGSFRDNEGTKTYTVGATIAAGSIIVIGVSEGAGTAPSLAASGDQVLIFTGSNASPTFVYGLNDDGGGVWQANATSSNNSALPTGLVNGTTAVAINEIDNAVFDFDNNGAPKTRDQWLAAIGDKDNWIGSNSANQTPSVTSVTVIPESSSAALLGLAGLVLLTRRRK